MTNKNNSRTKNTLLNIIFGFGYQFIALVLSFVSRTVFIHVFSVDFLGINGLFSDILQMLTLADLGFNTAMTYSFYKPLAENDKNKVASLINFYKKVYRVIAISVAIIGLALTPFVELIINVEDEIPMLHIYYLFSLAEVIVSYLFIYKTTLLIADQKNYYIVRISIVINILKTIFQIISILSFRSYVIYLVVSLFFSFINNYICSKRAEKEYPYLTSGTNELTNNERKNIFKNLNSIFLYKLSGILLNATDNIFISVLVNTVSVGYYSNYLMVNSKLMAFLSTGFGAVTASLGNMIVKEKEEKRYEVFQTLQSVSFILCGIVVSSYLILINDFIGIWLGTEFTFDLLTVTAIALNLYFGCVLQPIWSYREATGLYIKTKYIMLIAATLNILLSLIMGINWGIKGILLASIVSRLLTYIWYEPYLLFKKYLKKSVKKYFFNLALNVLLVMVIAIVNAMIFDYVEVDGWINLILKSIIVIGVTTIEFVLLYGKTEGCKLLINKMKYYIKNIILNKR